MPTFARKEKGAPIRPALKRLVAKGDYLLERLALADHEMSVYIASDEALARLNKEYRNIDSPTDVLSFSQLEGGAAKVEPKILGDVVISYQRAAAQARARGVPIEREYDLLLIHGALHLAGFDHERAEADLMEWKRIESELLDELTLRFDRREAPNRFR